MSNVSTAYIGLGANLGAAESTVRAAISELAQLPLTELISSSSLYSSAPIDAGGNDYVNAVAKLRTQLNPTTLLQALQCIEQQFGRERPYRNAPRTIDCDLLLYDDAEICTPTLAIPHPRMHLRAFVLLPLVEIAADVIIPKLGRASNFLPEVAGQSIKKIFNYVHTSNDVHSY